MENLIEEILTQLIEEAFELKINAIDDLEKGKLLGYYCSISKILNQSEAFGIADNLPKKLKEFNPEDLLKE